MNGLHDALNLFEPALLVSTSRRRSNRPKAWMRNNLTTDSHAESRPRPTALAPWLDVPCSRRRAEHVSEQGRSVLRWLIVDSTWRAGAAGAAARVDEQASAGAPRG